MTSSSPAEATTESATAHLVYCKHRFLLDRRTYGSWREIQGMYPDYQASLGPWTEREIVDFFTDDFGKTDSRWPFRRAAISAFFASERSIIEGAH